MCCVGAPLAANSLPIATACRCHRRELVLVDPGERVIGFIYRCC